MNTPTETEIVELIRLRVTELLTDRNQQPGKEMWVAWGESDDGLELQSLIQMLDASECYADDEFKDEL